MSMSFPDKRYILIQWMGQFGNLFGDTRSFDNSSIENIIQLQVNDKFDELPPVDEEKIAVEHTKSHKALCLENIPTNVHRQRD